MTGSSRVGTRTGVSRLGFLLWDCLHLGFSEVRSRPRSFQGAPGWVLLEVIWPGPLQGHPRTHTRSADAVEVVAGLALAAETSRGVHTEMPRPTGLRGRQALIHILQKRKTR